MSAVLDACEPIARHVDEMQPPLVQHFDLLATAPGGTARLRLLILSLATQGKLLHQDARDESALCSLSRIGNQRTRAGKAARAKNTHAASFSVDGARPFRLPPGWTLASVGDFAQSRLGKMLDQAKNTGRPRPYLRNINVQWGRFELDDIKLLKLEDRETEEYRLRPGDLLVCEGGEPGRCAVWCDEATEMYFQKALHRIRPEGGISPWFLALCLEADAHTGRLSRHFTGATIKHFTGQELEKYTIALPPVAEQVRIVARVGELMRLCDALEAKGRLEAEQHAHLLSTLLGTLTDSTTPEDLADNWQRVANHFDLLLDRPDAVDALEETVFGLAVRGLLVPQDPKDEPAAVLLERIEREKERFVTEGKFRRGQIPTPVATDEQAFVLPDGWVWVRLGNLVHWSEAGWSPSCESSPRREGAWGVLKVSAVSWGQFDPGENKELPAGLEPRPEYEVREGDFLLSRANTVDLVARSVVVGACPPRLMLSDKVIRLHLTPLVDKGFINLCNNASHSREHYAAGASGTSSSMKNVSRDVVLASPIALPPLLEQCRIMARVGEIKRLCADLRQHLTVSQSAQAHLADILIESSLT